MPHIEASSNAVQAPEKTRDPYAVLRNRDLVLYLIGRFAASIGQQMLIVAVGWELYQRTHSYIALCLVGLVQTLPIVLFTLPAGHVADNYERKRVIIWMTFVTVCTSIGLTLISAYNAPVAWIYGCLFLAASARTFQWPASSAFLPNLVEREEFSRAIAWSSGSFQLSSVAGPAAAGGLIALMHHAAPVYALNAVAALTCLTLMAAVRRRHVVALKEPMSMHRLLVGVRFVVANRVILGVITLDLFAVLFGGATSILPAYAKDILLVGPVGYGFLSAALPAGSLVCALFLAHRRPLQKAGRTMLLAVTGFGVATIGFGVSRWFWLSFLMLLLCGVMDNISVVVRHTLVQLLTPDEKRGRVSAVNALFIGTSNEMGGFESAFVAYLLGPVFSVVSGGIGTILVVAAVALIWPEIRKYGRLDS